MAQRAYHIDRPTNDAVASKPFRVRGKGVSYFRSHRAAMIEVSRLRVAGLDVCAVIEKRDASGEWVAQ